MVVAFRMNVVSLWTTSTDYWMAIHNSSCCTTHGNGIVWKDVAGTVFICQVDNPGITKRIYKTIPSTNNQVDGTWKSILRIVLIGFVSKFENDPLISPSGKKELLKLYNDSNFFLSYFGYWYISNWPSQIFFWKTLFKPNLWLFSTFFGPFWDFYYPL